VLRYRTTEVDDGLPPGEGTFLACSFWLVDNPLIKLSRGRPLDQAQLTILLGEMAARSTDKIVATDKIGATL